VLAYSKKSLCLHTALVGFSGPHSVAVHWVRVSAPKLHFPTACLLLLRPPQPSAVPRTAECRRSMYCGFLLSTGCTGGSSRHEVPALEITCIFSGADLACHHERPDLAFEVIALRLRDCGNSQLVRLSRRASLSVFFVRDFRADGFGSKRGHETHPIKSTGSHTGTIGCCAALRGK